MFTAFAVLLLCFQCIILHNDEPGDDSVMMKYVNPHMALIVTQTPPEAVTNPSICETPSPEQVKCRLQVTVLDTVSAKVIYRIFHDHGVGPIHSVIIENYLVYSYKNYKAKRTELSSIGLYEGTVDKFGLTPFASAASAAQAQSQKQANFSSFTASVPQGEMRLTDFTAAQPQYTFVCFFVVSLFLLCSPLCLFLCERVF